MTPAKHLYHLSTRSVLGCQATGEGGDYCEVAQQPAPVITVLSRPSAAVAIRRCAATGVSRLSGRRWRAGLGSAGRAVLSR
jgi:hypothetical protein